jgi:hypothetical protein
MRIITRLYKEYDMQILRNLICISTALSMHYAVAQDDITNPNKASDLFPSKQGTLYQEDPKDAELRKRCKEMSQKIEALRGRPLRRSALREEYKAECQRSVD